MDPSNYKKILSYKGLVYRIQPALSKHIVSQYRLALFSLRGLSFSRSLPIFSAAFGIFTNISNVSYIRKYAKYRGKVNYYYKKHFLFVSEKNITPAKETGFIINWSRFLAGPSNNQVLSYSTLRISRFFSKSRFSRNRQIVISIVQFGLFINIFFISICNLYYYQIQPNLDFFNLMLFFCILLQSKYFLSFFFKQSYHRVIYLVHPKFILYV